MSWQDTQEETKTLTEQFELLQQDMDRLMLAQSQLYENIEKNTKILTQETRNAQHNFAVLDNKRDEELEWIKDQKKVISSLTVELEKTFKEREKKTVLVKKWLELAFYGLLVVIMYQALTTSLLWGVVSKVSSHLLAPPQSPATLSSQNTFLSLEGQ